MLQRRGAVPELLVVGAETRRVDAGLFAATINNLPVGHRSAVPWPSPVARPRRILFVRFFECRYAGWQSTTIGFGRGSAWKPILNPERKRRKRFA